jgi:GT2 family glycosyltransferase
MNVSIIVLCYNGLEDLTKPCVESILKNTPQESCELILVDNGSSDGTAQYLREISRLYHNVKVIINPDNRGYSGGNNQGMQLAGAHHVVLLNNDTLVTHQWLDHLLYPLSQDVSIGMVGAVTNSAGNEQRIDLAGLNESNFEKIAGAYTTRQHKVWFETEKLGFFCVAIRRSVIEAIGCLDEGFGIGMFEDDDYCFRAKQAGYKVVVAEDCFVYHKGSASFNKLSVDKYDDIFAINKSYYMNKNKVSWLMSDFALSYCEKIGKDLDLFQKKSANIYPDIERIIARYDTFKHLLVYLRDIELAQLSVEQQYNDSSVLASRIRRQSILRHIRRYLFIPSRAEYKRMLRKGYLCAMRLLKVG